MNIIQSVFSDSSAYAFVWTLFHSLWQCLFIAIILAVFLKFNPKQSAHSRYLMAIFALVTCVITSIGTYIHVFESIKVAETLLQQNNLSQQLSQSDTLYTLFYQLLNRNIDAIFLVWLLGFAIQAYAYLRDFFRAQYLKTKNCDSVDPVWLERSKQLAQKLDFNKTIEVKNSTQVTSICVIGHFKPVILLPIGMLMSLPKEQVEALLLHELAHIKRNDYLVKAVQNFVRLLYFFNPSVIWISKMIDIERENACDDVAVKHCQNAKLYATSLANISELELRLSSVLAARDSRYKLLPRVTRLFASTSATSQGLERLSSLFCAVGMVFALNVNATGADFATSENVSSSTSISANPDNNIAIKVQPATIQISDEASIVAHQSTSTSSSVEPVISQVEEKVVPVTAKTEKIHLPPQQELKVNAATDRVIHLAAVRKQNVNRRATLEPLSISRVSEESPKRAQLVHTSMPDKAKQQNTALQFIDTPEFGEVYIADSFSLPVERKIYIADIPLEFSKVWLQRFKEKTSEGYRKFVRQNYASLLKTSLADGLAKAGWEVVNKPDSDAITLHARIHSLYIAAPDVTNIKDVIIAQSGQSGIELVFADSHQSNFMKIVDYRNTEVARISGFPASRATNQRYFRRLMKSWSVDAISYLNSVSELAQQQVSASAASTKSAKVPLLDTNSEV